MSRMNWCVYYRNGCWSVLMTKRTALAHLSIFDDALYAIKVRGWWRRGRRIYK